jgi:hypothetical protein
MILSMLYLLLLGGLLFGLILLVTGVILLLKLKNKLAGILVLVIGLVFTLGPLAVFLFQVIIVRIRG